MDDTNSEALNQLLEALASRVGTVTEQFDEYGNVLTQEQVAAKRRQEATEDRIKKEEAAFDKQLDAISKTVTGLTRFGNSLSNAPGSFGPLNDVIGATTKVVSNLAGAMGPLGKVAGAVASAFGEVAQMVVQQFEKAYGTFERLTEGGVVLSFEDMTRSSDALGLTFADTERVLGKSGKELAMFGNSAIAGRKEFERIAVDSETMRRNFQKLGVSAADFSEFQLSYIGQQQRYNRGQTQTTQELVAGSKKYIEELDTLSKLTGVNRKQLQSEQEARLRDARYRAGIATLEKGPREQIDQFLGVLKQTAPGIEEGMKDLIASGGVPVTEAGKAAMLALEQGGLNVQEVISNLRNGSMKGFEAFQKVAGAAGKAASATEHLTKIYGAENILTKNAVELAELEAKKTSMTQEEYDNLRKQIIETAKATEGQNAELANAKQSMYNAGRQIELLATSSDLATKAISMMATGIEFVTEKLYEMAGKELPAHLKARREERKAIEKETEARAKVTSSADAAEEAARLSAAASGAPVNDDDIVRARLSAEADAVKNLENVTAKRKKAEETRVAAEKAVGMQRPEDKKAEEQAAKPADLLKAETDVETTKTDLATLQARAALIASDIGKKDKRIKELEEGLKKEKTVQEKIDINAKIDAAKAENERATEKLKDANNAAADANKKFQQAERDRQTAELKIRAARPVAQAPVAPAAQAATTATVPATARKPPSSSTQLSLAQKIIQAESGGRNIGNQSGPGGKATSSAFGLAQFTKGTFEGLVKGAGKDNPLYGKTFEDYKQDTDLQREALNQLTDNNRKILSSYKVSTSDAAMYLAHFLGPYGASKVLRLPDTAPLAEGVSATQIAANPHLRKMEKIADIKEWADKKMGGSGYPIAAKNGALIQPTTGGTLVQVAEAGQAEAIVPLPDGRSIPVTIKNANEQTETMAKLFEAMSYKFDTMIELLSKGNSIQGNLLRNIG